MQGVSRAACALRKMRVLDIAKVRFAVSRVPFPSDFNSLATLYISKYVHFIPFIAHVLPLSLLPWDPTHHLPSSRHPSSISWSSGPQLLLFLPSACSYTSHIVATFSCTFFSYIEPHLLMPVSFRQLYIKLYPDQFIKLPSDPASLATVDAGVVPGVGMIT